METWSIFAEGQAPTQYRPGQFIYLQGAEPTYFYYLASGAARSYITSPEGGERVLTVHRSGDLMGEASFFDQSPRVSSAVAVSECKVFPIDRPRLEGIFRSHPELAFPLLRYLSRTVRLLSGHVDDITFHPAQARIARWLLSAGDGPVLSCTQEEIGRSVGVSRITVSRVLSAFAKTGAVRTGYGTVQVLDRPALERYAGPEDSAFLRNL